MRDGTPITDYSTAGTKRQIVLGSILIIVGVIGAMTLFLTDCVGSQPTSAADSLGEEIFLYGTADGRSIPRSGPAGMRGMMGGSWRGCADCHGTDGRGGYPTMMMGGTDAPDIRWSTLTGTEMEHDGEGEAHPPFDRDSFALAVREGMEPGGTHHLDPWMPRWDLSDPQIDALIEYLKEL